jgi:hypothetical protein
MVREDTVADAIVETILTKIRAMEELETGIVSKTGVTTLDRLIVIIGSFRRSYQDRILNTAETKEDVERVVELANKLGIEIGAEEAVTLGRLRRFVIEKVKVNGLRLTLDKIIDVDRDTKVRLKHRVA